MNTFPLVPNVQDLLNRATPGTAEAKLGDIIVAIQADIETLEAAPGYTLPAAATGTLGGVMLATAVPNSVAADLPTLVTNFNSLLTALRAAGVLHA